jgi:hypothetical protein
MCLWFGFCIVYLAGFDLPITFVGSFILLHLEEAKVWAPNLYYIVVQESVLEIFSRWFAEGISYLGGNAGSLQERTVLR